MGMEVIKTSIGEAMNLRLELEKWVDGEGWLSIYWQTHVVEKIIKV